ncbi:DUF6678 family protein [Paraburkholderia azotifigens]|uniref:DUF6678 family protein n=1 Tax=Paraburkholderia azotifigens TaxID=2057004 RepID=A0A5C6V7G4_9BURK|nr:hypothetical protein FRZ40_41560 [Paraburkholderia azotifigens]
MIPVMNDTKWSELRMGMHGLGELSPRFRVRSLRSGGISAWDREWFYHFFGRREEDEWVEVEVTTTAQHDAVLRLLQSVHVPGITTENGFRIFGYVARGAQVDYL